jgi:hypothetical protein
MKFSKRCISFLILFFAIHCAAIAYSPLDWNEEYDGIRIPEKFKMKYAVGAGFGIRNAGMFLETSVVLFDRFSLGGTLGYHTYNYKLYSSSDLHQIRMSYFPYMARVSIKVYEKSNFNLFLYGSYGQVWKKNRRGVTHAKPNETITWEAGIGAQFHGKVPLQFFLGQTYTNGKGNLESTYNSSIDFEMEIYNLYLGMTVSLFSNR